MQSKLKSFLEGLYYVYSRRGLINPDPLFFLYDYGNVRDLEIAGLIASSLAYGRVSQIMKSVKSVLSCLTHEPADFLRNTQDFNIVPEGFKHRFTTAYDMNNFIRNIAGVINEYSSIEGFLSECLNSSHNNLLNALNLFSQRLSRGRPEGSFSLITAPEDGSACKRLFLFLKWLVRHDDVDPGGWSVLTPRDLIIPTDTHMHQISLKLGLTARKSADLKTAIEITDSFRKISPDDPTKYDFVLTRFGIRAGLSSLYFTNLL
ncbi:MAG: TIGR02757 family protein [Synergistaceae bacterium]|nr:TIGR02757 family protein [Synergistaceae bacterium]